MLGLVIIAATLGVVHGNSSPGSFGPNEDKSEFIPDRVQREYIPDLVQRYCELDINSTACTEYIISACNTTDREFEIPSISGSGEEDVEEFLTPDEQYCIAAAAKSWESQPYETPPDQVCNEKYNTDSEYLCDTQSTYTYNSSLLNCIAQNTSTMEAVKSKYIDFCRRALLACYDRSNATALGVVTQRMKEEAARCGLEGKHAGRQATYKINSQEQAVFLEFVGINVEHTRYDATNVSQQLNAIMTRLGVANVSSWELYNGQIFGKNTASAVYGQCLSKAVNKTTSQCSADLRTNLQQDVSKCEQDIGHNEICSCLPQQYNHHSTDFKTVVKSVCGGTSRSRRQPCEGCTTSGPRGRRTGNVPLLAAKAFSPQYKEAAAQLAVHFETTSPLIRLLRNDGSVDKANLQLSYANHRAAVQSAHCSVGAATCNSCVLQCTSGPAASEETCVFNCPQYAKVPDKEWIEEYTYTFIGLMLLAATAIVVGLAFTITARRAGGADSMRQMFLSSDVPPSYNRDKP